MSTERLLRVLDRELGCSWSEALIVPTLQRTISLNILDRRVEKMNQTDPVRAVETAGRVNALRWLKR